MAASGYLLQPDAVGLLCREFVRWCSPLAVFRTTCLVTPSAHVILLLVWTVGQFLRLNVAEVG